MARPPPHEPAGAGKRGGHFGAPSVLSGNRPRFATTPSASLAALPAAVVEAIGLILDRHDPYPGVVFDHEYNVLTANQAFMGLAGMAGIAVSPGDNFLDAYLGPTPLRSIVVNWPRSAADLVNRIRAEARLQGPRSPLVKRIERLAAADDVRAALDAFPATERLPVLPIEMRIGAKRFNWITTLTSFGSAQDALVQGVLIESFFPADAQTRAHFEGGAGPKTKRE
jgi:hypothetical protein